MVEQVLTGLFKPSSRAVKLVTRSEPAVLIWMTLTLTLMSFPAVQLPGNC